jgi:hypothetical protein
MCVLRLLDARTGSATEITPASPRLLRVCAHLPDGDGPPDIMGLRMLLVADLLTRAAEMSSMQVLTVASGGQSPGQEAAFGELISALGMHPPFAWASCMDAAKALGGPADVHLTGNPAGLDDRGGVIVPVGAATGDQPTGDQADQPLVLRLALLSFPYHQPAAVSASRLASAGETLAGWRDSVARWAESPSKPMPASVKQAIQAALADLGTPALIALLHDLMADPEAPAGARFETFMYADRVLGLELASHIGR